MEKTNVVVIGGGVIGLAAVAEIARHYDDVFLLEAAPRLGLGTSTRNSGVIHAGLYYVPGSLKAIHCVRGAQMLYEFCAEHHVPHQRIGKLVVAESADQYSDLNAIKTCGESNGTEGLVIVESDFIRQHEPNVASPLVTPCAASQRFTLRHLGEEFFGVGGYHLPYCSSLTFSIQSTTLPSSAS